MLFNCVQSLKKNIAMRNDLYLVDFYTPNFISSMSCLAATFLNWWSNIVDTKFIARTNRSAILNDMINKVKHAIAWSVVVVVVVR